MNIEKRKTFIVNFFYICIWGLILYVSFKYVFLILMPFIVGFLIAYSLKPLVNYLSKKLRLDRKITASLIILIFYSTVGVLLTLSGFKIFSVVKHTIFRMPEIYGVSIEPVITSMFEGVDIALKNFNPDFVEANQEISKQISQSLGSMISKLSSSTLGVLSSLASSVPKFLGGVLFTVISTFYFAMDYYNIKGFVLRQLPTKAKTLLFEVKDYIFGTLLKYIKSYAIIMSITFIELSFGFSVLGIDKAIIIALLIALFDILPVLGTGGIMIPWVILEAIKGDYRLSVALSIMYLLVTVVRNILEPNIIGNQVGMHPLVTLMSIFVGIKLLGPAGLFILPVTIVILKNLNDEGKIHIIK